MNTKLIQKYNVPGPRYTSYPTVPYWDKEGIAVTNWISTVKQSFEDSNDEEGISLYIHLPFCEHLCKFCACHKHITIHHDRFEQPYIDTVLKEWKLYCDLLESRPKISEIHLGGGTPTFFSPENLTRLIEGIFKLADAFDAFELSYEGHPNHTSKEQIKTLYNLGARRNSFGVQDYDPIVQKAISRLQSFEQVKKVHDWSREIGYTSISHDLIFGLPFQTQKSIQKTIELTVSLMPDRLAYYSYAHVPWIKGVGQRGYTQEDLPKDKRALYELGKSMFFENGYYEIGMDHFSLPTDTMYKSMINHTLHRNFMGYSAKKTKLMIGLGMSSISDSWYAFAQNEKTVQGYMDLVNKGVLPIFRGHTLSKVDLIIRQHILNLMCQLKTEWNLGLDLTIRNQIVERLDTMYKDGLIDIDNQGIKVREHARMFIRNICMAFDLRLLNSKPQTRIFSMTI